MECLALLYELSKHIRIAYLKEWPGITGDEAKSAPSQTAYAFARTFYGIENAPGLIVESQATSPLVAVLDDLTSLSMYSAKALSTNPANLSIRETFVKSLVLFKDMALQLQINAEQPVTLAWKPDEWLSSVLECIKGKVFACIYRDFHKPTVTRLQCSRCSTIQCLQ